MFPAVAPSGRPCPTCGHDGATQIILEQRIDLDRLGAFSYASRKEPEFFSLRMSVCPACDTAFAVQPPATAELDSAYAEAGFDTADEELSAAATYAGATDPWLAGGGGAALEIGCGCGAFLPHLVERGFSPVIGIEPSQAASDAAAATTRPLIRCSVFSADAFVPESFSAICCFQTLEHVPDPGRLVHEACRLLRPGGLFLAVVHDRRAWINRLLGRRSPIVDIEHLQLFSRRSITRLLFEGGLKVERACPIVNTYPLRYWLRLLPIPASVKQMILAVARRLSMDGLNVSIPVGNLLAVGRKAHR